MLTIGVTNTTIKEKIHNKRKIYHTRSIVLCKHSGMPGGFAIYSTTIKREMTKYFHRERTLVSVSHYYIQLSRLLNLQCDVNAPYSSQTHGSHMHARISVNLIPTGAPDSVATELNPMGKMLLIIISFLWLWDFAWMYAHMSLHCTYSDKLTHRPNEKKGHITAV